MDRRLIGGLLFAVALTAAVVLPALPGVRLQGVASTIALPDDPQVGDCVLGSGPGLPVIPPDESPAPPAPTFAPCDGRPVAGEVAAVVRATGDDRSRLEQAAASGVDCGQSSLEYSGLLLDDGRFVMSDSAPDDPVSWNLSINMRTAWVPPAPLLQSAGRTWVACVVTPATGGAYLGRLAGAFDNGALPDEFGLCWEKDAPSIDSVSCASRHLGELMATAAIPDGGKVAVADIMSSCRRLVARVIGRSDPTAGGRLTVEVSLTPDVAQFLTLPQPLRVVCSIAPVAQALSGTVVGLRDRPIPYAG